VPSGLLGELNARGQVELGVDVREVRSNVTIPVGRSSLMPTSLHSVWLMLASMLRVFS